MRQNPSEYPTKAASVASLVALAFALLAWSPAEAVQLESWDQKLTGAKRFEVLRGFNDQAVLDQETQLVWERSPAGGKGWHDAVEYCYTRVVGGRLGWRLPTIEELTSLIDVSQSNPALPAGHPFIVPPTPPTWSITSVAGDTGSAWHVTFGNGGVSPAAKGAALFAWCVRGGHGYDGQ